MFPAKLTAMKKILAILLWQTAVGFGGAQVVSAQSFAAVGTRAAGMGGAFVGVADDATAIYWNPAGLATGSYFSLVLDGGTGEAVPDGSVRGGDNSSFMLGLAMPALGIGYYRLHESSVAPAVTLLPADAVLSSRNLTGAVEVRVDSLVTHHAGLTVVQSLWPGISVGTTLKLVRGIASSSIVAAATADEALDADVAGILGTASNRFDLDVGVMAAGGPLRVGLTMRNATEPEFETAGAQTELSLERQARAGLSYVVGENWLAAADFDLLKTTDAFGERRDVALGVEGRLGRRLLVRAGVAVNTVDSPDIDGDSRQAFSGGASYAVKGSVYVDGHFTAGNDSTGRQWGVAARFVY
jgi:hypothetical protein